VAVVARRRHDAHHSLDDYRGLAAREPLAAGFLAFFLLAQAGMPLTGGFVAKLEVFAAADDAGQYALLIVGVLAAVVAAFLYIRIVITMYAPESDDAEAGGAVVTRTRTAIDAPTAVVLVACAAVTLFVGILPGGFLDFAGDARFLL
jgi:NADH-quinone oxidoreductase subunit N